MPEDKKGQWVYGKHRNPSSWHETADVLKEINGKPKKSNGPGLHERLDMIEQLLREKK